ncbi:glycosyltransferase family 4 protein, partial [Hallella colorans]|uniref:glycosyltransferase family 4 protein n=1 Tax=Hallella colorans TaxID=1703337 RepID=UPI0023F044A0
KPLNKTVDTTGWPNNIHIIENRSPFLRRLPNLIWLNLIMPWLVRRLNADLYFSPLPCIPFSLPQHLFRLIVVHDVVNIEYQSTMQWTNIISNALFFSRSIRKADLIWTNSLYTRSKVQQYFPKRRCQQIFTGCSVNRTLFRRLSLTEEDRAAVKSKYRINDRFILFVGSLEPRKNLGYLLGLMPDIYETTKVQLVVVGGMSWKSSALKDIIQQDGFPRESVVFCNFVPNDDLVKLYNMADSFVSTSLNEGFGMPQLEALSCGCPVITSRNSAMAEITEGKSGAVAIEGYDRKQWISVIRKVIDQRPTPKDDEISSYDWTSIIAKLKERLPFHRKH